MTRTSSGCNEVRQALSRLRVAGPPAAKLVTAAVRGLAADPHPEISNQLGRSRFWRLRLGELRVTYEDDDVGRTIQVYTVGGMPAARRR
ncbi:MAG TPA: hypothetical protein VLJ59_06625 [Mycobacteriales bacterium]|nr:hypothetical protein [Mycobacteriales bacterium]